MVKAVKPKYYAGIGSRQCPAWAYNTAFDIAVILAQKGFTLRSGGADGMDTAFESGCDHVNGKKEIYLPWKGFNNNLSPLYKIDDIAMETAENIHPNWQACSNSAKKLHARNMYQITGYDWRSISRFIICYTPWDKGGTLQAIRIAKELEVPVVNLWDYDSSLWDTTTDTGRNEIIRSVLEQVLITRYKLKRKTRLMIVQFTGPYDFLSNFYPCEFKYKGKMYYTVENAYQSYKTDPPDERIRVAMSPSIAKKLGREVKLRSNWEEIKEDLMFELVKAKFTQNEELRSRLIKTKDHDIIEGNHWHDNEWGDCFCQNCYTTTGKNKLGKALMKVRDYLNKTPPFHCKLFNEDRYDGKCTDMDCEFCDEYYDKRRKLWWYHPESESYFLSSYENLFGDGTNISADAALCENVDDQIKTRVVNIKNQEYDVFCGRGSEFGNPFRIGFDGNRKTVIEKFRNYLYNNEKLQKKILELKGLRLGCYCSPEDCHVDVIAEFIENYKND